MGPAAGGQHYRAHQGRVGLGAFGGLDLHFNAVAGEGREVPVKDPAREAERRGGPGTTRNVCRGRRDVGHLMMRCRVRRRRSVPGGSLGTRFFSFC